MAYSGDFIRAGRSLAEVGHIYGKQICRWEERRKQGKAELKDRDPVSVLATLASAVLLESEDVSVSFH